MSIRKTQPEDLKRVLELYSIARDFMKKTGNPNQWGDSHPAESLIRQDIARGEGYVIEAEGEIEAAFMFRIGEDPTYRVIEDGEWIRKAHTGYTPNGVLREKKRDDRRVHSVVFWPVRESPVRYAPGQ